jgi:hypothetical protein
MAVSVDGSAGILHAGVRLPRENASILCGESCTRCCRVAMHLPWHVWRVLTPPLFARDAAHDVLKRIG